MIHVGYERAGKKTAFRGESSSGSSGEVHTAEDEHS